MEYQGFPKPSAPPPPYSSLFNDPSNNEYLAKLDQFVQRYEINPYFAERLHMLRGFEIVFICDDSGSMSSTIGETNDPRALQMTRWDELKRTVSVVVDLASVFDTDGVDVYFLNREPMLHVKNSSDLENLFVIAPEDGIPTDERERSDIATFEQVLRNERRPVEKIPITIIICTDDQETMKYLNHWDRTIPNLDVVHDYRNEKKEIERSRGKNFQFNYGDYISKILLGAIDNSIDNSDENF